MVPLHGTPNSTHSWHHHQENLVSLTIDVLRLRLQALNLSITGSKADLASCLQAVQCPSAATQQVLPHQGISIEWQELSVIVMAYCTIWFPHFLRKWIQILCNNKSVVAIINLGFMNYNFFVRARHFPRVSNNIADALSCFQDAQFQAVVSKAKTTPCTI